MSESGTEIADSRFLNFFEKTADPGFGLPSLRKTKLFNLPNKYHKHGKQYENPDYPPLKSLHILIFL